MRRMVVFLAVSALSAAQYKADRKVEPWIELRSAATERVLKAIEGLSPYEKPDLPLKVDTNYGNTAEDVEPYGGVKPYKRHFLEQMEYTGAGRAIPEPPDDLKSVKIGFIGPIMSTVSVATGGKSHEEPLGIKMLQGAKLAIEEANARGGYSKRRIPFELVTTNDNGLWGASGNEIINMAYKDKVWSILGTIDGANSHIAIRVALKAEVVMMNTGDTDPTFIETNIPWTMRCIGDDRQMGYLLIDYMIRKMDHKRIGIIRASNRYGRFGVREVRDSARRLKRPVVIEMAYKVGATEFSLQLDRLAASNLDAVVHWGNATEGALILNAMRKRGMTQPFYGSDRTVADEFIKVAGTNADGVMAGFPWNPSRNDPKLQAFRERFRSRYGEEPETYAAHGYDGMNMLIWATQVGGLNRAKIRDLLAYRTEPFPGVTGDIVFSGVLDDIGEVYLARFENGGWKYYSREQLNVPSPNIPRRTPNSVGLSTPKLAENTPQVPYKDGRKHVVAVDLPGRDAAQPVDVDEIRIGYFGPPDPTHPDGGAIWRGAHRALEEANRAGGYRGKPFRFITRWSADPWRSGASHVTRMVFQDRVWAVIGGIEGAGTHLAEQVVAKALVPLVNPAATDRGIHLAGVPWVFSVVPGDDAYAAVLARAIGQHPVALFTGTDFDSRAFTTRFRSTGVRVRLHVEFAHSVDEHASRVQKSDVVVIVAPPAASSTAVKALRGNGFRGTIAGGPMFGREAFLQATGRDAEGVIFPWAGDEESAGYDAARIVFQAIRSAGLNRSQIKDALGQMKMHEGAGGLIGWDEFGQNHRLPIIARVEAGRVVSTHAGAVLASSPLD